MCCWNVSPWLTGLKAGPATHSGSELTADTALTADTEASAYRAQRTLRVADTGPQRTLRLADTGPQRTLRQSSPRGCTLAGPGFSRGISRCYSAPGFRIT
jgi:hypothetical protein